MKHERDRAEVRFFPPGIPVLTILAGVALNQIWPTELGIIPRGLRLWLGAAIVVFAIAFLGFRAVRMMRGSGQSENPYKPTTSVLDTGPFAVTRNPMYLQMVLVCIGVGIALGNLWVLLLSPVCGLLLHVLVIKPEETYLERKFGDQYLEYKKRVRRWL